MKRKTTVFPGTVVKEKTTGFVLRPWLITQ